MRPYVRFIDKSGGGVRRMDDWIQFLAVMAALSTGAQAVTQQMKQRITVLRKRALAEPNDSPLDALYEDALRNVNIHFLAGINGAVLAAIAQVHPLEMLKLTPIWEQGPAWLANGLDYTSAGVIVAYGGPWFHDLLGILQAYKAQLRRDP
jgi:hypothetical protein